MRWQPNSFNLLKHLKIIKQWFTWLGSNCLTGLHKKLKNQMIMWFGLNLNHKALKHLKLPSLNFLWPPLLPVMAVVVYNQSVPTGFWCHRDVSLILNTYWLNSPIESGTFLYVQKWHCPLKGVDRCVIQSSRTPPKGVWALTPSPLRRSSLTGKLLRNLVALDRAPTVLDSKLHSWHFYATDCK